MGDKMIKLEVWACFNKGETLMDVNDISFENNEEEAKKNWKGQDIRRCTITIKDRKD